MSNDTQTLPAPPNGFKVGKWQEIRQDGKLLFEYDPIGIHKHTRLAGYTNDRRYVALVREFVEAVDNGRFRPGPVEIPE